MIIPLLARGHARLQLSDPFVRPLLEWQLAPGLCPLLSLAPSPLYSLVLYQLIRGSIALVEPLFAPELST